MTPTDAVPAVPAGLDLSTLRSELLALALDAADNAGELLVEGLGRNRHHIATKSSGTDMVTDMDRAAEALIVEAITASRPHDAILGEEGGQRPGTSGVRWVVDPLDGTTNYLYGQPAFAVSIAAEVHGTVEVGVVADPSKGETFWATRGGGSRLDGRLLACSDLVDLADALVATGFSYLAERRTAQAAVLGRVLPSVRDIRRNGAAALDLCWVACGRLDAYYEVGLQPWDVAAGLLIASEAGATVSGVEGGAASGHSVLAGAPGLVEPLRQLLDVRR